MSTLLCTEERYSLLPALKPYQQKTLDDIQHTFFAERLNRQLVQMPTGTGKTWIVGMLPGTFELKTKRMMMVIHTEELAKQAAKTLKYLNPSRTVGIEMADSRAGKADIVVASVQTLGRGVGKRIEQFNAEDFAVLVVDEAHHAVANSYQRIFQHFNVWNNPNILSLGVTATPNRADGKGLGKVYQKITTSFSLLDAIQQGWLSGVKGIKIKTNTSIDNVHKKGDDLDLVELSAAINVDDRNRVTAQAYMEHGEDRQFVAFATDIAHSKALAAEYRRRGLPVEAIWGDDPDRALKLARHKKGELRGLVNCQLLTEGYDD